METLPPPVSRRDPVPGNGRPWPDPRFETLERLAAALDRLAAALEGMRRLADPPSAPSAGPSWPAEPTVAGAASPQPTLLGILEQRGFVVKGMALPSDEAEPMNRLAWFLGERHALLRSQLRKIRAAMNNGLRCSVDLADASAEEISANCQFATSARDLGLLEEFQYVRHPRRVLHLVCNRDPAALNFFSGGWLERYLEAVSYTHL
ncbi:MAG: hypothetical protein N2109_12835, partial [Fimbriimonadales bacterium]|nr:hypothetical protein [Fimbriimonadales bacterium]